MKSVCGWHSPTGFLVGLKWIWCSKIRSPNHSAARQAIVAFPSEFNRSFLHFRKMLLVSWYGSLLIYMGSVLWLGLISAQYLCACTTVDCVVCVSLCVSLCLSLPVSISLSVCSLSLCFSLCMSLSVSLSAFPRSVSLSELLHLVVSVFRRVLSLRSVPTSTSAASSPPSPSPRTRRPLSANRRPALARRRRRSQKACSTPTRGRLLAAC